MNYKIENNKVILNGRTVDSPVEAMAAIAIDHKLVVLFNKWADTDQHPYFDNVVCLDESGKPLWRIQEFTEVRGRSSFYTGISLNEKNELLAYNPMGFSCRIDIETGKIIDYAFVK